MTLGIQAGDGAQALDLNQLFAARDGFSVLTSVGGGCQVSKSGTSTVTVDRGEVLFDGSVVSVSSQTVAVPDNTASNPRKDVVFVDGNGSAQLSQGTPAPAKPAGETGRDTFQPAPNDLSDTDAVVLAEVFVPSGVTAVDAANISDRRVPSELAQGFGLPDDTAIRFGDNDDAEVRFDDSLGAWVVSFGGEEFQVLPDGTLRLDGQLETAGDADIGGDISFNGTFSPSDINADSVAADAVDADVELSLPVFSDNSNAVAEDSQVWFNDGSGPNAAGVYFYDGGVIGPLATGTGSAPASLSGLTIDTTKDFDGFSLTGLGHDEVDVPQTFDLTVDDFERASLGDDYVGDTQDAQIQSSVALEGSRSLQLDADTNGFSTIRSFDLDTYPQIGDTIEWSVRFTDVDDNARLVIGAGENQSVDPFDRQGYHFGLRPEDNDFSFIEADGTDGVINSTTFAAPFSNHVNEWLTVRVEWGVDFSFNVSVSDSVGSEIFSETISPQNFFFGSGGIQLYAANVNTSSVVYYDSISVDRRVPEETRNRQRGSTETSKLQTRGGIGSGPPSATPNQRRRTVHRHPVTTDAQQGQRYVDAQTVGGSPVAYVEGQFDGNGGSYADRFQAPLGRFARINANLSFDVPTFSDLPYYGKFASAGTDVTVSLNGLPRELTLSHDGDGSRDGIVRSQMLTNVDTLGPFRIEFSGVNMTKNDTRNRSYVGLYTDDIDSPSNPSSGSGVVFEKRYVTNYLRAIVIENGTIQDASIITDTMFNGETYAIEMDSDDNISFLRDGEVLHTITESISGPLRPYVNTEDNNNTSVGDSLTVSQITVSPLTEVLR